MRQEREREVAVGDGLPEGTGGGALLVNMDPLMVERGIGKHIDALLRHFDPFGRADYFAFKGGELFVRIDNYFFHNIDNIIICILISSTPLRA